MDTHQPMPRLNEPAPNFEAVTTHGPRSLADCKGKWLVLFSHPADFTPVRTTEFIAFARNYDKFQALGCDLLGLSIDSNFAHIAWVRNIEEKFGVQVPFPIIEDLSMAVAHAYGMIQPGASDTSAVRATFFIPGKQASGDGLLSHEQRSKHRGISPPPRGASSKRPARDRDPRIVAARRQGHRATPKDSSRCRKPPGSGLRIHGLVLRQEGPGRMSSGVEDRRIGTRGSIAEERARTRWRKMGIR